MWQWGRGHWQHAHDCFPQDQRQTEAIQLLQAQLTNMTQLASNLSATVAELKREVITIHRKYIINTSLFEETRVVKWSFKLSVVLLSAYFILNFKLQIWVIWAVLCTARLVIVPAAPLAPMTVVWAKAPFSFPHWLLSSLEISEILATILGTFSLKCLCSASLAFQAVPSTWSFIFCACCQRPPLS